MSEHFSGEPLMPPSAQLYLDTGIVYGSFLSSLFSDMDLFDQYAKHNYFDPQRNKLLFGDTPEEAKQAVQTMIANGFPIMLDRSPVHLETAIDGMDEIKLISITPMRKPGQYQEERKFYDVRFEPVSQNDKPENLIIDKVAEDKYDAARHTDFHVFLAPEARPFIASAADVEFCEFEAAGEIMDEDLNPLPVDDASPFKDCPYEGPQLYLRYLAAHGISPRYLSDTECVALSKAMQPSKLRLA